MQNAITSTAHPPEPTVEPKVEWLLWLRKIDIAEVLSSAINFLQGDGKKTAPNGPFSVCGGGVTGTTWYHKHNSAELQKGAGHVKVDPFLLLSCPPW